MVRLILAAASIAIIAAPAVAASCRDAKTGHFTHCTSTTTVKTTTAVAVTKDAKGKCHFASGPKKGQFTKCPA